MTGIATVDIDIVSDIMCPWCLVGLLKLDRALAMVGDDVSVLVRWRPFELNPDLPPEGQDWARGILEKYGRLPDPGPQPSEIAARELGYDMSYHGPGEEPPRRSWNTFNAHKLMMWALDRQGAESQSRLARALFAAHFRDRRNVSDQAVLVSIAEEAGIDTAGAFDAMNDPEVAGRVRAEESAARSAGINSVPTFILNGHFILKGSQEPEALAMHLRRMAVES